MKSFYRLAPQAAIQIGVNHFADDRPRANDRDLHHDVVKFFWFEPRQTGHLRATLDLKKSDRVGGAQSGIDSFIVFRQTAQVNFFFLVIANEPNRIFQNGHHSEAEKIDFDDAHVRAIFFVPLNDDATGHGGGFQRNDRIELALTNDHSAGVLAQMARKILHFLAQFEKFQDAMLAQV